MNAQKFHLNLSRINKITTHIMANFKNKAYSSKLRQPQTKDYSSYYYHITQEKKQDKLILDWMQSKYKHKQG